jgi:hypothetical protein
MRRVKRRQGSEIVNTHPIPGTSRTLSAPRSASMLCRAIDRQMPRPDLSSFRWLKGVNIVSAFPTGRPPQWSATSINTWSPQARAWRVTSECACPGGTAQGHVPQLQGTGRQGRCAKCVAQFVYQKSPRLRAGESHHATGTRQCLVCCAAPDPTQPRQAAHQGHLLARCAVTLRSSTELVARLARRCTWTDEKITLGIRYPVTIDVELQGQR